MAIYTLIRTAFGLTDHSALSTSGESYSGKVVNAETSLQLATVYACVRLISQMVGSLPLALFEQNAEGDKVLTSDTELLRLVSGKPNANMTATDFWQSVIANMLLWGNAYNLKKYRGTGTNKTLVSLEPLLPEFVTLKLNKDGSLTYQHTDALGKITKYSEDQIVHFKGFGLSGRVGLSVISFARQSFGNALAIDENIGRLYSNGMRPGGALTMPTFLKQEQRDQVRTNIADQVGGVANSGGTIILEGGMKYEALSMPPEDAQMIESKSFSVEEICRWFGVPPILVGHNTGTTTWGSGIEQLNIGFLTYALQPIITKLEQEIDRSIVPVAKFGEIKAAFDSKDILRADSKGRAELYSSAAQNGWMSREEIRRRENLPRKDGSGDLTVQSNLTNLEDLGNNSTEDNQGGSQ